MKLKAHILLESILSISLVLILASILLPIFINNNLSRQRIFKNQEMLRDLKSQLEVLNFEERKIESNFEIKIKREDLDDSLVKYIVEISDDNRKQEAYEIVQKKSLYAN